MWKKLKLFSVMWEAKVMFSCVWIFFKGLTVVYVYEGLFFVIVFNHECEAPSLHTFKDGFLSLTVSFFIKSDKRDIFHGSMSGSTIKLVLLSWIQIWMSMALYVLVYLTLGLATWMSIDFQNLQQFYRLESGLRTKCLSVIDIMSKCSLIHYG